VIGPIDRPSEVVAGLPIDGEPRMVGRSAPLTATGGKALASWLRPAAPVHPCAACLFTFWGTIALLSGIAACLGFLALDQVPAELVAFITALATGAILAMLADTMIRRRSRSITCSPASPRPSAL